jgi:hypothetical protein
MKKLEIMMTIKANTQHEAEGIAKRELAELAKAIAFRNGSFMIDGECDVTEVANGNYKAKAIMNVAEYAGMNETVYTVQALWMTKPDIIKSAVFVGESEEPKVNEEPKRTCKMCGRVLSDDEDYGVVNEGMETEHYMCYDCIDTTEEVWWCETCECYMDNLVENPVSHKKNICPRCGDMVGV